MHLPTRKYHKFGLYFYSVISIKRIYNLLQCFLDNSITEWQSARVFSEIPFLKSAIVEMHLRTQLLDFNVYFREPIGYQFTSLPSYFLIGLGIDWVETRS